MKILISPAKSLDYKSELPTKEFSYPKFIKEATFLNDKMASKSKKEISELMKISDKLAELNYQRYQEFLIPFTTENARQAVFAFSGDVYTGIDAYTLSKEKIKAMQKSLRILSGMYGVLKPLDLIQPYRLEMGTRLQIESKKSLYEFWDLKVTEALNEELKSDEILLNLASQEYFKVVKPSLLKVPVISPVFKDYKNGKLKIISFYAKRARGSMVRFILDNNCNSLEDIKGFNYGGYGFSEEFTTKKTEPVFIR